MEISETYKYGNTTVHIVAPQEMTEQEKKRRILEMNKAFSNAWSSLSEEKKMKINDQCVIKNG